MMEEKSISFMDVVILGIIRQNVSSFLQGCAEEYDKDGCLLLDIAPLKDQGAREYFKKTTIKTLDIDLEKRYVCDYILDICNDNSVWIMDGTFDFVVCTEVLEHVLNPFAAVKEIKRILKYGGIAFVTTPFNFRKHKPLPDCWRFTDDGLRELFRDFEILELNEIETKDRWLMPIQHTMIARKR